MEGEARRRKRGWGWGALGGKRERTGVRSGTGRYTPVGTVGVSTVGVSVCDSVSVRVLHTLW